MKISRLDINCSFPIETKISNCFATSYSYDFNGNITNLRRYDNGGNLLHSINYGYEDRRNRLGSINVTGSDISSSSYRYDALGNLITDTIESIHIDWNVIGKVRFVQTPNNMLRFAYNPFGQRQIKRTDNNTTYYIHDATGNVMGIYIKDDLTLTTKERPIYGSSRLGIMNKAVVFNMNGGLVSKSNSTIGIKEYELSDHLGNVSVVILDRKKSLITNIQPIIISNTDYYPFGYPISSRSFSLEQYRYGFNGQEKDNEVYGDGKSYSYEFRNYDSRIGRWWSIDKLKNQQADQSTYKAYYNNPILFIDKDGLKEYMTVVVYTNQGTKLTYRMQISMNIMTDGVPYTVVSKISSACWWYENRFFDYEHVITYVEDANGVLTQKGKIYTNIMTNTKFKDSDYIWAGGDKRGKIKLDYNEYLSNATNGGINFVTDNGGPSPTTKMGSDDTKTINITVLLTALSSLGGTPGKLPDLRNNPLDYAALAQKIKDIVEAGNDKKNPKKIYYCIDCKQYYDEKMNIIFNNTEPATDTITVDDHEKKN